MHSNACFISFISSTSLFGLLYSIVARLSAMNKRLAYNLKSALSISTSKLSFKNCLHTSLGKGIVLFKLLAVFSQA